MLSSTLNGFVVDTECSYIDGLKAKLEYIAVDECPVDIYQAFLERGWRRFGLLNFRPICDGCTKCDSLRIIVDEFETSKSMRKVRAKNKNTKVLINKPSVTREKIELYDAYHRERSSKKGWEYKHTGEKEYFDMLVNGQNDFAFEVCFYIDDVLAGVDYIDIGVDGISAVYFIANPKYYKYSLGVFSLLIQIELAKHAGLKYIYLGYGVRENNSLNYKYRYEPLEILEVPTIFGHKPTWRRLSTTSL